MLFYARLVGPTYEPPNKVATGGILLEENPKKTKEKRDKLLRQDADIFGLSVMGDGATIKKKPFFNILAYGYHVPAAVLAITDCTKHLVAGGKKDAEFIAKQFLPHMEALDPMKDKIDLFIVDGASNVQKAGQVVEVVFPRVSVLHGSEHCLSLTFTDIAKIPAIKVSTITCGNDYTVSTIANIVRLLQLLILKTSRIYRVFGSGSFHAPHAQFQDAVKTANKGRAANLLRAAKTRMSYFFYAMHRSLRLSNQLLATVHSAKWEALKLKKPLVTRAVEDIKDKLHWKRVYVVLRAVWPILKLLCISDSDKPGMDKVFYLCHKAKEAMAISSDF